MVHHSKHKFVINLSMCEGIKFFCNKLKPTLTIRWETPIAHLIPCTPTSTAFGDSCLEGACGYSIELGFWWHIDFPKEAQA